MKKTVILLILALIYPSWTFSDRIYTWTDAHGVKRFSDEPPSQDISDFKIIDSISDSDPAQSTTREAYRRMIADVEEQNRQSELEEQEKARAQAEEQRKKEEAENQARLDAIQQALQERIDALNNRALSPGFTEGMRQAQIMAIQEQINQLEAPPKN